MTKGLQFETAEALALGRPELGEGAGIVSRLFTGRVYENS